MITASDGKGCLCGRFIRQTAVLIWPIYCEGKETHKPFGTVLASASVGRTFFLSLV